MPEPIDISLYIEYGKIGQFLVSDHISEYSFFGNAYYNPHQAKHIMCATHALLNAVLNFDGTNMDTLVSLAEYQYSLYSAYITDIKSIYEAAGIAPPTPVTFEVFWGWSDTPFDPDNLITFNYQMSGRFDEGTTIIDVDYTDQSIHNYLALKYPSTIPDFKKWYNSQYIYGEIPDQVFNYIYTSGDYSYAYTRVIPALEVGNKHIVYS